VLSILVPAITSALSRAALWDVKTDVVVAASEASVEVLLPKGGRRLQLSGSGWSAVLGVDADGGTPDGDFAEEGGGRVAARRCPCGLFAVLAGAVSNLICEADNEL
jgi:hypothetical protein